MTNQDQLVALVDSIKERFDYLMKDIKDAASLYAFTAYAEARKGWCYPSHVVAFDEFVRGLFDGLVDVHKEGKQLLVRNDEPLEDEEDDEDDYTVEYFPPVVDTKGDDEDDDETKDVDRLDEKEVEAVQENVYYFFATALAMLKRAVQADVYLSRDDLERLTNDVRKSLDDAWKEREKTFVPCETRRHAIERLRFSELTR